MHPPPQVPDHELLQPIGRGAYGEVWLARNVVGTLRAVKVVYRRDFGDEHPFDREFRGIQKFEPISRSHPGLVNILQIGRNDTEGYLYYVMELADDADPESGGTSSASPHNQSPEVESGTRVTRPSESYGPRTLRSDLKTRGRLPAGECVEVGLSLTSALDHLHQHGLVHRDIKPSNIIFVNGRPKLADIGLVAEAGDSQSIVGTEGYLAPEGPGSPQADLFSLGKLLYEMSTGQDRRQYPDLPMELKEWPDASGLRELNEVVLRACAKDVEKRYPSVGQMHTDLLCLRAGKSVRRQRRMKRHLVLAKRLGIAVLALTLVGIIGWLAADRYHVSTLPRVNSVAPTEAKTIAVLPFDNEIPDEADKNLGVQMAEELRNRLKRISGLRVLEWDSAVALKKAKDPLAAARQIKLNPVVTGTVRGAGDRFQLTVQLINTANGRPLWSAESVDRNRAEMLSLPKELAEQLARALNLEVTEIALQQAAVKPKLDPAAQDLYWLGRRNWNTWTASGMEKAIACFEQAIQKDPNYAQAYAGLADCYISGVGPAARAGGNLKARENAEKAMQLGPNVSEAHASQGYILEIGEDWKGAETAFKRALELDPNNATAHSWYGIHLARMGQYEAGIQEARLAQELDPLSSGKSRALCWVLTAARQYDAAIEQFENNLRLPPSKAERGDCYFYKGLYEAGIAALQKAAISHGEDPEKVAQHYDSLREAYLKSGPKGYWQRELELAQAGASPREGNEPMNLAVIYAWLGDKEQTIAWLEKSGGGRRNVNMTPVFDLVRADPRYQALLKKAGLPEPVWK